MGNDDIQLVLSVDKGKHTVKISDTGLGVTREGLLRNLALLSDIPCEFLDVEEGTKISLPPVLSSLVLALPDQKHQESFQKIVEAAPNGMIVVTAKGTLVSLLS